MLALVAQLKTAAEQVIGLSRARRGGGEVRADTSLLSLWQTYLQFQSAVMPAHAKFEPRLKLVWLDAAKVKVHLRAGLMINPSSQKEFVPIL